MCTPRTPTSSRQTNHTSSSSSSYSSSNPTHTYTHNTYTTNKQRRRWISAPSSSSPSPRTSPARPSSTTAGPFFRCVRSFPFLSVCMKWTVVFPHATATAATIPHPPKNKTKQNHKKQLPLPLPLRRALPPDARRLPRRRPPLRLWAVQDDGGVHLPQGD